MTDQKTWTAREACALVGVTYRQIDYWARTDMLRPSVADAWGSGSRRLYSERDILLLKITKTALDFGMQLNQVRRAMEALEGHNLREGDWIVMTKERLVVSGEPNPSIEHMGDGPFWIFRIRLEEA